MKSVLQCKVDVYDTRLGNLEHITVRGGRMTVATCWISMKCRGDLDPEIV
jgi:hypothetical protein